MAENNRDLFAPILSATETEIAAGRARWEIAHDLKSVIRRTKKLVKLLEAVDE